MWVTGLVNRSISSTALGSSDGSARSIANWSGWSSSAKRTQRDEIAGGLVACDEKQEGEVEQIRVA